MQNTLNNEIYCYLKDYFKGRTQFFSLIFFGGYCNGSPKKDIDLAIVVDKFDDEDRKNVADYIRNIHLKYGFQQDFDIPYENKLLYTTQECESVSKVMPCYDYRRLCFEEIKKDKDYLSSDTMRLRLLANILFINKSVIGDSIEKYEKQIGKLYIRCAYYSIGRKYIDIEDILNKMFFSDSQKTYKDFLGFDYDKHFTYLYEQMQAILKENDFIKRGNQYALKDFLSIKLSSKDESPYETLIKNIKDIYNDVGFKGSFTYRYMCETYKRLPNDLDLVLFNDVETNKIAARSIFVKLSNPELIYSYLDDLFMSATIFIEGFDNEFYKIPVEILANASNESKKSYHDVCLGNKVKVLMLDCKEAFIGKGTALISYLNKNSKYYDRRFQAAYDFYELSRNKDTESFFNCDSQEIQTYLNNKIRENIKIEMSEFGEAKSFELIETLEERITDFFEEVNKKNIPYAREFECKFRFFCKEYVQALKKAQKNMH